jgi:hypothetical protein
LNLRKASASSADAFYYWVTIAPGDFNQTTS